MKMIEWLNTRWFRFVHGNNLVYNTCWEDPRLDHVALQLTPDDNVLVITSAGCNALDYALKIPNHVYAVDMNPRQNALLELKKAAIRTLDYETFFQMFGEGRLPYTDRVYDAKLRDALPTEARKYWDRHIGFFKGGRIRPSFYFCGTSGLFARTINFYVDRIANIRNEVMDILNAPSLEVQKQIYEEKLREKFWKPYIRWMLRRDATLAIVGVPKPQRVQVEKDYEGGIARFVEDCLDAVFAKLPLQDNYFWRVYMTGRYTRSCCPEYLKEENFYKFKGGLIDKVTTHTASILDFLKKHNGTISRYVLLDHMDWLSTNHFPILEQEWQAIVDRAAPGTKVIYRSGGLKADFVDQAKIRQNGKNCKVGDVLHYHPELASELHVKDRVHTYGSFYIADLVSA
jgi:S-adenosylmethionine-diacylglycerol 3-amino-3-carboxypropyl transferase